MSVNHPGVLLTPPAVAGIISVLDEKSHSLKESALMSLYDVVDQYWAEMANIISVVEELSEDVSFSGRKLAAATASKIFFHLEEYDEALRLALGAGSYFDVSMRSEYVETLVSRCIDKYIAARDRSPREPHNVLDPRMLTIVERMFLRCYDDGDYEHAVGIALEAQQLDKIKEVIIRCPHPRRSLLFSYVAEASYVLIKSSNFRVSVMRLLIILQESSEETDYLFLRRAWQDIGDASEFCKVLLHLLDGNEKQPLLAFQLAFDLMESGSEQFISDVRYFMTRQAPKEGCAVVSDFQRRAEKLQMILSIEGVWSEIQLSFLVSKSNTDILILKSIKDAIDGSRSSILHNALVIAHSIMNAGTTDTTFLRENLDWMGNATNWAKFNATASIGVVHMGHIKKPLELLQPYLPSNSGMSASPYSEGGALYAVGLVHANRGSCTESPATEVLLAAMHNTGDLLEPLQHGACLGIGLTAMGSGDQKLYKELKSILAFDSAVAGEAAAYGIGLLLAGHGTQTQLSRSALSDLISYAHETTHEKIIRSTVLSSALIMFAQETLAEPIIEQLCRDRDAIIRYGGVYAIGLAYAGTAQYDPVKRLLHVAVSDVSDDVRRAAVMCLGMVLFRTPEKVPTLVALLAESFNPHVRYGACLAIGIACAGTGSSDSLLLLEPMLCDPVDFVRQGCLLALALIFMQQSEHSTPSVRSFREKLANIVKDKYPSSLTKLGAIIAAGIIDAGGRNCSVSLSSSDGFIRSSACIGFALWTQHWYWYPMLHFFALGLLPSMFVGLDENFQLPKSFSVICAADPSKFAYPPRLEEKKETKRERIVTAILSTTRKQQARDRAREREQLTIGDSGSERDNSPKMCLMANRPAIKRFEKDRKNGGYNLFNPSRLIRSQQTLCSFRLDSRYTPAAVKAKLAGVVVLVDRQPAKESDSIEVNSLSFGHMQEAARPPPFSWPLEEQLA